MLITYRDRAGTTRQRNVVTVAPEVQGRIIGSGDIDRAAARMNTEDLRAWISQTSVFQRLTPNAKVNVRRRGV
jgi:hypothetical protein